MYKSISTNGSLVHAGLRLTNPLTGLSHNRNRSVLDGDPAIEAGIYSLVAVTRGTVLAHRARAVIDGGAPLFLFKGVFSVAILARERAKL